jgi:hypothetical protein
MNLSIAASIAALLLGLTSPSANAQFAPQTKWYWQLSGTVNTTHNEAPIYDIDMEGASNSLISQLKQNKHTVVCYIDDGGWEPYRQDAKQFPASVIGNKMSGWNEIYLDIRSPIVRVLMSKRMDTAKSKGCDAIEPDVMDTYTDKNSGFPITKNDEIDYAKFWSQAVHDRGMKVALKNDAELVSTLASDFDFSIAEQCFDYKECPSYNPFIKANKAVLVAEYTRYNASRCAKAKAAKESLAFFNMDLDGKRYQPCP